MKKYKALILENKNNRWWKYYYKIETLEGKRHSWGGYYRTPEKAKEYALKDLNRLNNASFLVEEIEQ
jgi:hypothetical protein